MKQKPGHVVLSPCQIVAWNLEGIRRDRGLTQEGAARELEPYLGYRLSRAAFSQAERCLHSGRIRRFDADEIVAFARAFEVPIPYFFGPPQPYFRGKLVVVNGKPSRANARIRSPHIDDRQMRDLAQGFSEETVRSINELAVRHERDALSEAALRYLEKHPDQVGPALLGIMPKEFHDQLRETIAASKTSVAEQRRLEEIAQMIRDTLISKSPESAARGKRRPRRRT